MGREEQALSDVKDSVVSGIDVMKEVQQRNKFRETNLGDRFLRLPCINYSYSGFRVKLFCCSERCRLLLFLLDG